MKPVYRNWQVPEGIRVLLEIVLDRQILRDARRQGIIIHADAQARRNDALESVLVEHLHNTQPEFDDDWSSLTEEQQNKYLSRGRDDYRCLRCGASKLNRGGVQSHHVIPKGAKGDPMYDAMVRRYGSINAVENLATLCPEHHEKFGHGDWRTAAKWLLGKMGVEL